MPPTASVHTMVKAGITNDDGEVYREVVLFNLLEMLHLTAKLNALGYHLDGARKQVRSSHFSAVFSRPRRPS